MHRFRAGIPSSARSLTSRTAGYTRTRSVSTVHPPSTRRTRTARAAHPQPLTGTAPPAKVWPTMFLFLTSN